MDFLSDPDPVDLPDPPSEKPSEKRHNARTLGKWIRRPDYASYQTVSFHKNYIYWAHWLVRHPFKRNCSLRVMALPTHLPLPMQQKLQDSDWKPFDAEYQDTSEVEETVDTHPIPNAVEKTGFPIARIVYDSENDWLTFEPDSLL
jgi:hypothetical protein